MNHRHLRNQFRGDANDDGTVDSLDAQTVANNWLRTGDALWADGDFNGDFTVDDKDATILAANWSATSSSVPEPTMSILLVVGGLCLAGRVRRKRR